MQFLLWSPPTTRGKMPPPRLTLSHAHSLDPEVKIQKGCPCAILFRHGETGILRVSSVKHYPGCEPTVPGRCPVPMDQNQQLRGIHITGATWLPQHNLPNQPESRGKRKNKLGRKKREDGKQTVVGAMVRVSSKSKTTSFTGGCFSQPAKSRS